MPEPFDLTVPLKQSLIRIKVHSQPSKLYTCLYTGASNEPLRDRYKSSKIANILFLLNNCIYPLKGEASGWVSSLYISLKIYLGYLIDLYEVYETYPLVCLTYLKVSLDKIGILKKF